MASSSLYDQLTREHPAYRASFDAGLDVGLAIALSTITAEWVRLEQLPSNHSCRNFAEGRLLAVQRRIAVTFRQVTL